MYPSLHFTKLRRSIEGQSFFGGKCQLSVFVKFSRMTNIELFYVFLFTTHYFVHDSNILPSILSDFFLAKIDDTIYEFVHYEEISWK